VSQTSSETFSAHSGFFKFSLDMAERIISYLAMVNSTGTVYCCGFCPLLVGSSSEAGYSLTSSVTFIYPGEG